MNIVKRLALHLRMVFLQTASVIGWGGRLQCSLSCADDSAMSKWQTFQAVSGGTQTASAIARDALHQIVPNQSDKLWGAWPIP